MSEQSDNVFRKLDQDEKIRELADEICGSDEQAAAFCSGAPARELSWSGVRLYWQRPDGTRTVALSDPEYLPHVKEKYGFLLKPERPAPLNDHPEVTLDPATVELALAGNMTAKGAIARAFGGGDGDKGAAAADLFLKAERAKAAGGGAPPERVPLYSGRANGGDSDNPFGSAWSKTRQGQIYKSDPALAARLSKAAGFPDLTAAFAATKPKAA
jgi:hypothetical protein